MKEKKEFKPYISADKKPAELTKTSIVLGIILAVVFGGANAYLGLRVGMTVSASIPAAVVSMGIIRILLKRDSVLENNIVQTIGSAGESVAAGAIFTLPVLFMWADELGMEAPGFAKIVWVSIIGGVLGILFMVPLRKALIVKEHGKLPYPEGTACAEVLLAGEEGGSKASAVFVGMGAAAIFKFLADGIKLFSSQVHYEIKKYKGAGVGVDVLPALLGVGYICGTKIAAYMLSGSILAWLVFMPLISLFGENIVMFPGTQPIASYTSMELWSNYIRYIGAGAVAAAGIMSLIKSLPMIWDAIRQNFRAYNGERTGKIVRTEKSINIKWIIIGIVIMMLLMWLLPSISIHFIGTFIVVLFGFLFATVSSRMVGLVGSSNNPISGMAIATLLFATLILKVTGTQGLEGMIAAITIGSIICIITAVAGDTSQDLKTGYILGATPQKQQYGEIIGAVISAFTIEGVLYLLSSAWGYGTAELPAPQATLMKLVVEGVMEGNLPWNLILIGVFVAVAIEILGIPVMPFAVGLYLPIHLSTGIMAGGLIRLYLEKKKYKAEERKKETIERGVLFHSGMIAGEGLVGISLAILAIIKINGKTISEILDVSQTVSLGNFGGILFFCLLIGIALWYIMKGNRQKS